MLGRLWRRLQLLFQRDRATQDLEDEMRLHRELRAEQLRTQGIANPDAAASRRFGNATRIAEESRDSWGWGTADAFRQDVRYGLRALRRTPAVTAVALVTLALGLGANTAIFTVVNAVLFRPLAYHDPARLTTFDGTVAAASFLELRSQARSFERLGAAEFWTPTLGGGVSPEQILALHVSADVFPLLGVAPVLGRMPRAEEEHAGREQVAVLSYPTWIRRFAADSGVVGQTIRLNGVRYTVIGVMPASFQFAPYWATAAELWAPLMLDARTTDRNGASLRLFGRLGNGATIASAQSELNALAARFELEVGARPNYRVVSLHEMVVGNVRTPMAILLGAVGLVLLIACANVSHLQLMRAAARERELAVRVALGAARARLVQQSLVESTLLSFAGGFFALFVAYAGVRLLVSIAPPSIPRLANVEMNGMVFAFLFAVALLASVLFGVAPALRAAGVKAGDALKQGSRGASDGKGKRRLRGALVISEFAMALLLLVGASLLLRSFVALQRVDFGFDPRNALTMFVSLDGTTHREHARRAPFFAELLDRVRALPGVVGATAVNHLPIAGDNWHFPFAIEGRARASRAESQKALFRVAQPGFFGVMRITLSKGREFSLDDATSASHVAIINETMARRYWPDGDPIGKRISVDDPEKHADWFTIVGVAKDATQARLTDATEAEMYFPYMLDPLRRDDTETLIAFLDPSNMMLFIRAKGDPGALTRPVQSIVQAMDRDAAVAFPATMQSVLASQFVSPAFYLMLFTAFAGVAVVLAAVGVYGVMSYAAAGRAREMGVRIALGASASEPFKLIAVEGMRLAILGAAIGLSAAFLLTRFLRALLFGVQPTDPGTFVLATVALTTVALLACFIPARKAAKVDPALALRSE